MSDNKTGSNVMVIGSLLGSGIVLSLIVCFGIYLAQQVSSGHPCVYDPSLTNHVYKGPTQ